jgi:hypothetical protein
MSNLLKLIGQLEGNGKISWKTLSKFTQEEISKLNSPVSIIDTEYLP